MYSLATETLSHAPYQLPPPSATTPKPQTTPQQEPHQQKKYNSPDISYTNKYSAKTSTGNAYLKPYVPYHVPFGVISSHRNLIY